MAVTPPVLSVIVPCLDEAAGLAELVARVGRVLGQGLPGGVQGELVLVDDGSRDQTWLTMGLLQAQQPWIRIERHPRREGIPAAWRTGLARAEGTWVCVLDADLQYEPEEIPRLWREQQRTGADIVQGARAAGERPRDVRFVLSRGLNVLLNAVFGMSLPDNKSGFFLCRREVLEDLLAFRGSYRHWQCFVMVAAHRRGHRIHALPTPFHPRRTGRSAFGRLGVGPAAAVALDLVTALREYGAHRGAAR